MINRIPQTQEYLRAVGLQMRFGRHEAAKRAIREAWRCYYNGLGLDAATQDDLHRFGVLARIAGVGATPAICLAFLQEAMSEQEGSDD